MPISSKSTIRPHRIRSACSPDARAFAQTTRQKRSRQVALLRHLAQVTAQSLHRLDWAALSAAERQKVGDALHPLWHSLLLARTIIAPPQTAKKGWRI